MRSHFVHMRDQKANQSAMIARNGHQAFADVAEELMLVVVLWGVFILASLS